MGKTSATGSQDTPAAATNLGVACYAQSVAVTAGQALYLCVQPGQTFCVAFYYQGTTENLTPAPAPLPLVCDLRWVSRSASIFTSFAVASPQKPDLDWNWPRIGFAIPATWPSGVYFAIAYPVNSAGVAADALGTAVQTGDPQGRIKPHPDLSATPYVAWDHGMALFVIRPTAADVISGTTKIAYMLPVSTYHAYNNTGPGCFYYAPTTVTRVTLRRPGCGVGSPIMDAETDSFDTASKRNTYAHWDARFIRWLAQNNIACHFYTNFDMDYFQTGLTNPVLNAGGQPAYSLLLSVGHDEYWGMAIRDAIQAYQQAGGNIAIFSGNTCYRPVGFGAPSTTTSKYDPPPAGIPSDAKSIMCKLNETWPDSRNEASTIGVTFKTGAGSWSKIRSNAGYTVKVWWFTTVPTFGTANSLVGYECDGLFPGHSPANYVVMAHATLTDTNQWDQTGNADMGYFQRNQAAPPRKSILFNCATTDWARFLPLAPSPTDPDVILVQSITQDLINRLTS